MKLLMFITMLLFMSAANAGDPHYGGIVYAEESLLVVNDDNCGAEAVTGASGQHHYKATTQLQWSVAGAFTDGNCNDSAVSFGLGLQAGDVFTAANFSSNGESNMIGVSASGTF